AESGGRARRKLRRFLRFRRCGGGSAEQTERRFCKELPARIWHAPSELLFQLAPGESTWPWRERLERDQGSIVSESRRARRDEEKSPRVPAKTVSSEPRQERKRTDPRWNIVTAIKSAAAA